MIEIFLQRIKKLSGKINSKVVYVILFFLLFGVYMILSRILEIFRTEVVIIFTIGLCLLFSMLYEREIKVKKRCSRKVFNFTFLILTSLFSFFIMAELNWVKSLGRGFTMISFFVVCTAFFALMFFVAKKYKEYKSPPSDTFLFPSLLFLIFLITYLTIVNEMEQRGFSGGFLLFCAFFLIGFLAICSSRFRDLNQSMWYCFGLFVPFYNIYLLYRLIFVRGTKGENQYGPDPLEKPAIVQLL